MVMGGMWLTESVERTTPDHELKPHFGCRAHLKKKKYLKTVIGYS